jgi:hypothetical protein
MIELLIFHLHLLVGLYAFTKYWQTHRIRDGFLAVGVVFLVFVMGWSIMGTIADVIYPDSFKNDYLTQDTLELILLVIPEGVFFYYFFIKK